MAVVAALSSSILRYISVDIKSSCLKLKYVRCAKNISKMFFLFFLNSNFFHVKNKQTKK